MFQTTNQQTMGFNSFNTSAKILESLLDHLRLPRMLRKSKTAESPKQLGGVCKIWNSLSLGK